MELFQAILVWYDTSSLNALWHIISSSLSLNFLSNGKILIYVHCKCPHLTSRSKAIWARKLGHYHTISTTKSLATADFAILSEPVTVLEEAATVFKVNAFCFSFSIKNVTPVEPFLLDNINSARCIGMRAKITSVWEKLCWKCQLLFRMVMQIMLRETTS